MYFSSLETRRMGGVRQTCAVNSNGSSPGHAEIPITCFRSCSCLFFPAWSGVVSLPLHTLTALQWIPMIALSATLRFPPSTHFLKSGTALGNTTAADPREGESLAGRQPQRGSKGNGAEEAPPGLPGGVSTRFTTSITSLPRRPLGIQVLVDNIVTFNSVFINADAEFSDH